MDGDKKLISDLDQRRSGMDVDYNEWQPHFKELRDNIQPARGKFSLGESRTGATLNKKIIDPTARLALRTLKAGLMAGVTSPSRPWFKLGLHNKELMNDPAVKSYMHVVQSRMYDVLRGSNVYRTLDTCYGDLGLYGTFGGLIVKDFENVIHTHSFPMGMYRISEDDKGNVDVIHWDIRMKVSQVVKKFGLENCSDNVKRAYKNNSLSDPIDVRAAVEVRRVRDPMSHYVRNMPVAAYYWEAGETGKFLQAGGHSINGILAPRWERRDGEAWAISSPGMDALGDSLQLQGQQRDKAMAIKMGIKPPMQGPAGSKRMLRNIPGGVSTLNTTDLQRGGFRATHEVRLDIGHLTEDIRETQSRINASFFADLFRMVSAGGVDGVKNVTATAIAEMHEEKLIALGPVLESLDHGLLVPIIEATFHFMQEAEILPPAPDIIADMPIKVDFISLLAQAQRAIGIAAIERTVGFAGSLEQIKPGSIDLLNGDEAIREFADQVGPPPSIINTDKDV